MLNLIPQVQTLTSPKEGGPRITPRLVARKWGFLYTAWPCKEAKMKDKMAKKREVVGEVTRSGRELLQLYACRAGNSPQSCTDPSAEAAGYYFFLNSPTTAHT